MNKIKKFISDHQDAVILVYTVGVSVTSIVAYGAICKHYGYRMSSPLDYNEETRIIRGQGLNGKIYVSKMAD